MPITPVSPTPYNPNGDPYIQSGGAPGSSIADSLEFFVAADAEIPQGDMSISFLAKMMGGSSTSLSAAIKAALQQDAQLTLEYFKYLASTSSDLLNIYNTKEAQFLSDTMLQNKTGPAIVSINSNNTAMQSAINAQGAARISLTQATADYQVAVDAFNSAPFDTDEEKAAARTDLNNARAIYNLALQAYNSAVLNTNTAITAYRDAVTAYKTLIDTEVNPTIENRNKTRLPPPPIPLQSVPADQLNWSYTNGSGVIELNPVVYPPEFPPQPEPDPQAVPLIPVPPTYAVDLIDPRTLVFTESLKDLETAAEKFFGLSESQLRVIASLKDDRNPTGLDYLKRLRLRPEADTKDFDPKVEVTAGGPGGLALAALTLNIRQPTLDAVLSQSLMKQPFIYENTTVPTELYSRLLTMTLKTTLQTGQLASFPGVAYLNGYLGSLPPNSPAVGIAAALGYNTTLIGLLNNQGLLLSIQNILGPIASLQDLTALQKQALATSLSALVSDTLVKIGVNVLADQLGVPSVNDTLKVAALVANPNDNTATYKTLGEKLAALVKEYNASSIATPLAELIHGNLVSAGVSDAEAEEIAARVSTYVTQQGLGETPSQLQNLPLGSNVSEGVRSVIFESVVTFSAAASLKQEVQASLISSAGPAQALNLSDNIVKNLYGFSVDVSQSTITRQETIDQRPISIHQIAVDNQRVLLKTSSQETLDAAKDRFTEVRREDKSLDALLRMTIDPGKSLFGLMYEGSRGSSFERKSVDSKIA